MAEAAEPARDPVVVLSPSRSELAGAPRQAVADARAAALDGRLVHVVEDDLVAVLERDLGDPGTHRPRADDADDGGQPTPDAGAARIRPS